MVLIFMWIKINTRRLAPQMAIAWNLGLGKPFQKHYSTSISTTLQHFNGKNTDYYVDSKEYDKFNEGLRRLLGTDEFIGTAYEEARQFLEKTSEWSESALSVGPSELSNRQLAKLFGKFALEIQPSFYARMWMVYRISHPLEAAIEKMLLEATRSEEKAQRLLKIFSTPLRPNNVQEERLEAALIAAKRGKISAMEYESLVRAHAEKYAYIPMYGFDHNPYSVEHFRKEIGALKDPKREFRGMVAAFERKKRAYDKAIMYLRPSRRLVNLLKFYSDMAYLRDYRDMLRSKVNFNARNMYIEIAKRARIDMEGINLLTNGEIIGFLSHGKLPGSAQINSRRRGWVIIQDGDNAKIFEGKKAAEIAKAELVAKEVNASNYLKGQAGSAGVASGIARIIHSNKDLGKIKPGEIMLTSMTRQDYIPYLRKCAALVTDEGGITSHAAIICRELKIPCIVGTEFATQTFKNGDRLEVDANKGVVKRA